jgi:hypothetical protein
MPGPERNRAAETTTGSRLAQVKRQHAWGTAAAAYRRLLVQLVRYVCVCDC